ncbi:hypothetical protein ACG04R_26180 [Roseateles sp. BYS78W]|uniref:Uncharacterized protein n=1 Tax=Pelomonas candidula TaxID=3299025 RepID=A0ABW7HJU4_9BURK
MNFQAKRKAPKPVAPLVLAGVRYEAPLDIHPLGYSGHGGVIAAFDDLTGAPLWHLRVYQTVYDPHMEGDVRDVYITQIAAIDGGQALRVTNERSRNFRVDLADRSAQPLD